MQLSWQCSEALITQEILGPWDLRLSPLLFAGCRAEREQLCGHVAPGARCIRKCSKARRVTLFSGLFTGVPEAICAADGGCNVKRRRGNAVCQRSGGDEGRLQHGSTSKGLGVG